MNGLNNLGNTCYLNSALQMMLHMPEFCKLMISNESKSNEMKNMSEFIKSYHKIKDSVLSPKYIKRLVGKRKHIFSGYGQQDSAEFIIFFLDMIDNIIKEDKINKLFGIKTTTTVKCKVKTCLTKSITKDTRLFLMLSLKPEFSDLDDCYRNYKDREKLCDNNMYFCEKCQKKRMASKRLEISEWPKNLIVWLKRFELTGRGYRKNNMQIDCPLEWRHGYNLYGGIIHSGGTGGGHYVYFGKMNDKWYLFNDSSVSEIPKKKIDIFRKNAYILHYRN